MAHHARLTLLNVAQLTVVICALVMAGLLGKVWAGSMPESAAPHADIMWQALIGLLCVINTVFVMIGTWMISNIRELLLRIGKTEANVQTMQAVCDERHDK